ncbi:MAG: vWA domain-containing protein, partial [Pirellulales bacterium]
NIGIACSKSEGFKDYFDIGIFGYGTDQAGNPIIAPALEGPLAGRELVSVKEASENPARIETVTILIPDEETGEMIPVEQKQPVWIDPHCNGATPICSALAKACEIIDQWIPEHESSFPPIVINITDGESTEGDPMPYADTLKQRMTNDGNVLFFNCHLSSTPADSFQFAGNGELMPDEFARNLFDMSSLLPESMAEKARNDGQNIEPNARGMVYNGDMLSLIKFLDIGTRAASTLR